MVPAEPVGTDDPRPNGAHARGRVEDAPALFHLLGDRVTVVHEPDAAEASAQLSGADIDCVVAGLDPVWPLRMTGGWALRQYLHCAVGCWNWVVEHDGRVLWIDTLDDVAGYSPYGFPTRMGQEAEGFRASPALRGAFLTAKRVRKGNLETGEWRRIGEIARRDADDYASHLQRVFGRGPAAAIAESALAGIPPDFAAWRQARWAQQARRFRSPRRLVNLAVRSGGRFASRLCHPTGLSVLIAGPDGAGKSALADALPATCADFFRSHARLHWRPGLLPRPGAFVARDAPDPTTPHARTVFRRPLSMILLGYYWLDFLLGGWLRIWPKRVRSGLVIIERGWHDIAVDPRRYRLGVSVRLVRALGRALPRPDVALILEAPPRYLHERKPELSEAEVTRQSAAWRDPPSARMATVHLDVSHPLEEVLAQARSEILDALERQSVAALGYGWVALPTPGIRRWLLPRGPRLTATAGLRIYQPVTSRGRLGWEAARAMAGFGAFRLFPRGEGPPAQVRHAVAPYVPPGGTYAAARANHAGRHLVLMLDGRGRPALVAKVATGPRDRLRLAHEAEALEALAGLLAPPLSAPRVIASEPGVLVLEALDWLPRRAPWQLPEEVAFGLGRFSSAVPEAAAHGDCAPWNLLLTTSGWALVDWEDAKTGAPPFKDVCHYLVQAHALLRRPSSADAFIYGFTHGTGPVGIAVAAYARGAGLPLDDAVGALWQYLTEATDTKPGSRRTERFAVGARRRLLGILEGTQRCAW